MMLQGKTEKHIDHDEGGPHQPTHLRIAQPQVAFEQVDHERESKNEYRIPGPGRAGPGFARRVSRDALVRQRIGGILSRFSTHPMLLWKSPTKKRRARRKKRKIFVLFVSSWLIFIPSLCGSLWLWRSLDGASPRTPIASDRLRLLQAELQGFRRRAPSTLF